MIFPEMNIKDKFKYVQDYFSPKIIGEVNDMFVKIARIKGDKLPWHNHKDEDELFYIVEGRLLFEEEGKGSFELKEGDLYIVKKGINHKVSANEECKIMLIEKQSTEHTGEVESEITKSVEDQRI